MKRKIISAILLVCMTATIAAGCGSDEPVETVDLNSMTLEEIEAQAKEEGELASAAMPDTWANWGETWQEYTDTYGIEHVDTDMSSAEEISLFETEGTDATKDIGDVGQAFGPVAEEQDVALISAISDCCRKHCILCLCCSLHVSDCHLIVAV